MRQIITILGIAIVFLISCTKPQPVDDPSTKGIIRYDVTGNFTGALFASYTTASSSTANEQVTTLIPGNEDEFTIKGVTGYSVKFEANEKNDATAFILSQPNGSVKAEKRK